jgi:hypothetical protein
MSVSNRGDQVPRPMGWDLPKKLSLSKAQAQVRALTWQAVCVLSVALGALTPYIFSLPSGRTAIIGTVLGIVLNGMAISTIAVQGIDGIMWQPVRQHAAQVVRSRRLPVMKWQHVGDDLVFELVVELAGGDCQVLHVKHPWRSCEWAPGANPGDGKPITARFIDFEYYRNWRGDERCFTGICLLEPDLLGANRNI